MKSTAKRVSVAEVEPLIEKFNGNVAAIARALGVSRGTVWNRCLESPTLMAALKSARETMIDNAESTLYREALNGNVTALIFFLKTQGKDRGYTERTETRNITIPWESLNEEQLQRIADGEDPYRVLASA